jgi:acyl-CoA thioesterase FadM
MHPRFWYIARGRSAKGRSRMAFEHNLRVRFQHTDPAGIVFFGNVLVFCHEPSEELLRAGGLPLDRTVAEVAL